MLRIERKRPRLEAACKAAVAGLAMAGSELSGAGPSNQNPSVAPERPPDRPSSARQRPPPKGKSWYS